MILFLLFHFRRQNYKIFLKYAKIFAYFRKKQYFCTRVCDFSFRFSRFAPATIAQLVEQLIRNE